MRVFCFICICIHVYDMNHGWEKSTWCQSEMLVLAHTSIYIILVSLENNQKENFVPYMLGCKKNQIWALNASNLVSIEWSNHTSPSDGLPGEVDLIWANAPLTLYMSWQYGNKDNNKLKGKHMTQNFDNLNWVS